MEKRQLFVNAILVMIAVLLSFSCGKKEQVSEEIIRPIRYTQVFSTGIDRLRSFAGTAQAPFEAKLSFKVNGTMISRPVKLGDNVTEGQLIAELDPKDYILQVQEADAALTRARAEARNAAANYERVRLLYESDNASLSDLDIARAQAESTQAQVGSFEKQLELAKLQLSYTKLTAPVSGWISSEDTEVNENVGAGKTIVTLTSGRKPEVQVAIPEILIAEINRGHRVTVRFDALEGKDFEATVTKVGISPEKLSTTFPVTVELDSSDPNLRPGMAAEVTFRFQAKKRFIVPPVAVGEDQEGKFLFIVESDGSGFGTVKKRPVTVGELTSEGIEVREGLLDGDLVVIAGVSKILDGQKVRVPEKAEAKEQP
ncbi:MAG: efflux RND transporter periplasmic adaptor subunit [Deltaproteobacteria bacterium]|nr:efflux RND transporter periplasmic adaptor subunit [Deltaproteobacteria bacterium]NIS76281.1 efflux RND transporter periplasmic adaptor subunit [Deltaproteobacteria bacterium]